MLSRSIFMSAPVTLDLFAAQGLPLPGLGSKAEPAALQVNSQRIQAGGSGWWHGSQLQLHKALEATLDYTPAVTK